MLFRHERKKALPANAEIVTLKGKPHYKRLNRGQRPSYFALTPDGTHYLYAVPKWAADVVHANGHRKRIYFSTDKSASQMMLSKLLKRIRDEQAGLVNSFSDAQAQPVSVHLADWQADLEANNTAEYAKLKAGRARRLFDSCNVVMLSDVQASAINQQLAKLRHGGRSIQTVNFYLQAAKQFFNWLIKDQRTNQNPIQHLEAGNVKLDRRHDRRNFQPEEFQYLLHAARQSSERFGLSGEQRARLYTVAICTGLRAAELASLTHDSFDLTATPPTVTVEAAYSKRERRDVLPLHPELVQVLRPWLAEPGPLWPGTWAKYKQTARMIRSDLAAARSAWLAEANDDDERTAREQSSFLMYQDQEGEFLDFHSLRHSFITNIVQGGASAKEAQELARHSTVTLTLDRYSHVSLNQTAQALARTPFMAAPGTAPSTATFGEPCQILSKIDEQESPGMGIAVMPGLTSQVHEKQGFEEDLVDLTNLDNGRAGIRTLGQDEPDSGFQDRCIKPLCHPSSVLILMQAREVAYCDSHLIPCSPRIFELNPRQQHLPGLQNTPRIIRHIRCLVLRLKANNFNSQFLPKSNSTD
jgi:site-specific recombinase XerD